MSGTCMPPSAPADPNDKLTLPTFLCEIGTVLVDDEEVTRCVRHYLPLADAQEPLTYTITFENLALATASAEFVTITDTLDANLNPSTLEVYSTSSDSTFSYSVSGQVVTFRFVGIDLPPNVTPPEGEGFVTFGVEPYLGLGAGTEITNEASIVFDFNPAIETPAVIHELRAVSDLRVDVVAQPEVTPGAGTTFTVAVANLQGDAAEDVVVTITPPGTALLSATPSAGACTGEAPIVCEVGTLTDVTVDGEVATVTVVVDPGSEAELELTASATSSSFDGFLPNNSAVVSTAATSVGVEATEEAFPTAVTLGVPYPNPARGVATFRWGVPRPADVRLRVYDLLGREVMRVLEGTTAEAGWHTLELDVRSFASGVYFVRLESGRTVTTQPLLVVQ